MIPQGSQCAEAPVSMGDDKRERVSYTSTAPVGKQGHVKMQSPYTHTRILAFLHAVACSIQAATIQQPMNHGNNKQVGQSMHEEHSRDNLLRNSTIMMGLHDLSFETLERVCEIIAGSRPSNFIPFSEVSKRCLAASSQSLWHTVPLCIRSQDQVLESVDRLKHVRVSRWRPKSLDEVAWQPLASDTLSVHQI